MTQDKLPDRAELAEALALVLHTGYSDQEGWFACWRSADPDAAADYFRYRVCGCPTEVEAVAAFLNRERDRLERLEMVADLVRQQQVLEDDPAHQKVCDEVHKELMEAVADLAAGDSPPATVEQDFARRAQRSRLGSAGTSSEGA
jgi:hypothetical protein